MSINLHLTIINWFDLFCSFFLVYNFHQRKSFKKIVVQKKLFSLFSFNSFNKFLEPFVNFSLLPEKAQKRTILNKYCLIIYAKKSNINCDSMSQL